MNSLECHLAIKPIQLRTKLYTLGKGISNARPVGGNLIRKIPIKATLKIVHSGEKNFKFEFCGKSFGRESVLTLHKIVQSRDAYQY